MLNRARFTSLITGLALAYAGVASAQISTTDSTAARIPAGAPTPVSGGVGYGFGGQIGSIEGAVRFEIDSDSLGRISMQFLDGSCGGWTDGPNDVGVIYIDSTAGGFADTSSFTDVTGAHQAAISAGSTGGTANASRLDFPMGFRPDFAIAFESRDPSRGGITTAALYRLTASGAHVLVPGVSGTQLMSFGCSEFRIDGLTTSSLGIAPGDSFRYVATLLNSNNGYRSNEFQGFSPAPVGTADVLGNIGTNAYSVPGYSTFTTVGEILINELRVNDAGTDDMEFIELLGPPGIDLTDTSLVFFNGSATGDPSYVTVALAGQATDSAGYFVVGDPTVTPDLLLPSSPSLQNGPDAVGFYLLATPRVGTPVASMPSADLVDAIAYRTLSASDVTLANALHPGQPQPLATTDDQSINRCAPGRLMTTAHLNNPASPGGANDCSVCGNGIVEAAEECDDGGGSVILPAIAGLIEGGPIDRGCCTSACTFQSAGAVCRSRDPIAFGCDVPEVCSGTSAACPPDLVQPGGYVCRVPDGLCDAAETCNGSTPTCPLDGVLPATTECSPSLGACDPAEFCDGRSNACPPNQYEPTGVVCRAAAPDSCDAAEMCTGSSPDCPADAVAAAGTMCRGVAGMCDVPELCDGVSADCPVDGFEAMGTPCRPSTDICDPEEVCTGTAADCPMDMISADGTSCADSLACNGRETCSAGVCGAGVAPSCDDSDLCTTDMCAEPGGCSSTPIPGCCNIDGDCDDGDACTANTCSGPGGTCSSSPITDCCVTDGDCDDANACTADSCDMATNRCVRAAVPGCCTSDADCGDMNACTTDTCDVATGACTNDAIGGCCVSDGDCNDDNTCTLDVCSTTTSTCTNDDVAGCCLTDADCDDMDDCTTDMCNPTTATCSTDRIPGCGRDGGVGFDDAGVSADGGPDLTEDAGGRRDGSIGVGGDGSIGDAGTDTTAGGCGCRATSSSDGTAPLSWLLALGGLFLWRRRRS